MSTIGASGSPGSRPPLARLECSRPGPSPDPGPDRRCRGGLPSAWRSPAPLSRQGVQGRTAGEHGRGAPAPRAPRPRAKSALRAPRPRAARNSPGSRARVSPPHLFYLVLTRPGVGPMCPRLGPPRRRSSALGSAISSTSYLNGPRSGGRAAAGSRSGGRAADLARRPGSVTTAQSVSAPPAKVLQKNNGYCNGSRPMPRARRAACRAGKHTRAVRKCCITHYPT